MLAPWPQPTPSIVGPRPRRICSLGDARGKCRKSSQFLISASARTQYISAPPDQHNRSDITAPPPSSPHPPNYPDTLWSSDTLSPLRRIWPACTLRQQNKIKKRGKVSFSHAEGPFLYAPNGLRVSLSFVLVICLTSTASSRTRFMNSSKPYFQLARWDRAGVVWCGVAAGTDPDLALDTDGELLVQPDADGCVLAAG